MEKVRLELLVVYIFVRVRIQFNGNGWPFNLCLKIMTLWRQASQQRESPDVASHFATNFVNVIDPFLHTFYNLSYY